MAQQEKRQSALMRPVHITDELASIVGKGPMARTEITKNLWVYIKANNLQDPKAKKIINPDKKLGAVLKSQDPIDMFQLTKAISTHIKDVAVTKK